MWRPDSIEAPANFQGGRVKLYDDREFFATTSNASLAIGFGALGQNGWKGTDDE